MATEAELEKALGHNHDVKITKHQREFLKKHLPTCPRAKENKSLIATLSKSEDFSKVSHVIPPEKK